MKVCISTLAKGDKFKYLDLILVALTWWRPDLPLIAGEVNGTIVSPSNLQFSNPYEVVEKIEEENQLVAKHTNYILVNERGILEMVTYAPEQDYTGQTQEQKARKELRDLKIDNISHDLWKGWVYCHRVEGEVPFQCKIVAKMQYFWDMSKPLESRATAEIKSSDWEECFTWLKRQETEYGSNN